MKTPPIHETEFILHNIFSSQIGIELTTQVPSRIVLLMRKAKRFINNEQAKLKHDDEMTIKHIDFTSL